MQIDWKTLFLSKTGRIGRPTFWVGFLILMAISFLSGFLGPLALIVGLALVWPFVAVFAKRLHDLGRTGWVLIVPFLITFVSATAAGIIGGQAMVAAMDKRDEAAVAALAGGLGVVTILLLLPMVACAAFLAWVGLSRGDPEPNRFGPPPAMR